ncbi:MAG: TolC family protein [Planctomycetes bacterium]|nr:TolC family protein [Planctomycetota bacterium]
MSWRGWISVGLLTLGGCRGAAPNVAELTPPMVVLPGDSTPVAPLPTATNIQLASHTSEPSLTFITPATIPMPAAPTPLALPPSGPVVVPAPERVPDPTPRLNLFQAIETSLAQNPDLTTLRRNEGVSRGALGVAQTYPFNPFVQVQATPLQQATTGGAGTVYHYVLLMQQLQLGHQQRFREEAGMAALQSVRWNILQAELNNVAQTQRLYFIALYQRALAELMQATADLNRELLDTLEKQKQLGQASGADVAIVRLDAHGTRQQAELAVANYQTALLDLRRQLNLPPQAPLALDGDLRAWRWEALDSERVARALCASPQPTTIANAELLIVDFATRRPDVMAARADASVARANANVARGSLRPDLQIGPYYQRTESGTTYWGFRAQSDIPVVNTGMPLVRQREAEVAQRSVAWQQLEARAQVEAAAAVDRYQRAHRLGAQSLVALQESLPGELRRLEEQFKAGEVDILRVVAARTSLINFQRAHLDSLNELAQAAAVVTQTTGLPPETILSEPAPPAVQK